MRIKAKKKAKGTRKRTTRSAGVSQVLVRTIYENVHLGGGDVYLSTMMRDNGGHLRNEIPVREAVLFVNRTRSMVKILGCEGLYIWKCPTKHKFNLADLLTNVGLYFGLEFIYDPNGIVVDMQPLPLKFRKLGQRPMMQF